VIPVASAPTGGTFHVPMVVPTGGLAITSGLRASSGSPAVGAPAQSDAASTATPVTAR